LQSLQFGANQFRMLIQAFQRSGCDKIEDYRLWQFKRQQLKQFPVRHQDGIRDLPVNGCLQLIPVAKGICMWVFACIQPGL